MEESIQELEEKKRYYQQQLREIKAQLKLVDQALAELRGYEQPSPSSEPDKPECRPASISARTPLP